MSRRVWRPHRPLDCDSPTRNSRAQNHKKWEASQSSRPVSFSQVFRSSSKLPAASADCKMFQPSHLLMGCATRFAVGYVSCFYIVLGKSVLLVATSSKGDQGWRGLRSAPRRGKKYGLTSRASPRTSWRSFTDRRAPPWGTQLTEIEDVLLDVREILTEKMLDLTLARQAAVGDERPAAFRTCPGCHEALPGDDANPRASCKPRGRRSRMGRAAMLLPPANAGGLFSLRPGPRH